MQPGCRPLKEPESEMDLEQSLDRSMPAKSKPETSGHGKVPGIRTVHESHSLATESSGLQRLAVHKATGPRTDLGKQVASRNATKHGVFSKVVLLKGESPGVV